MVRSVFFILAFAIALVSASSLAMGGEALEENEPSSFTGPGRFLRQRYYECYNARATMTCDKFPRMCRSKGSPGPDCCKRRCVNVMTDGLNCRRCGAKCRYGRACCKGKCVVVMYDRDNCGGCKKRCKKGTSCRYGMCSYA